MKTAILTAPRAWLGARAIPLLSLMSLAAASRADGQVSVDIRGSTLFEAYELSQSQGSIDRVSELSLPVTMNATFGRRVTVTVATGYARVTASNLGGETSSVKGVLDTEARLALEAVPDRVAFFTTATLPTGLESLEQSELPALGLLASDVIGFSAPNLGGGGAVGGGIAVTAPAGRMAVGAAASFTASGSFQPVQGQIGEFRPGGELRLRLGIEGPVARRSFLRVSGIYARRGEDRTNDQPHASVGDRISGYVSLNQGVGSTTLTVYAFDLYRSAAGVELTAVGPSFLNRGNVFAGGATWSIPLANATRLTPRVELRDSRAETGEAQGGLERLGTTTRFGIDLRQGIGPTSALVLRADRLSGSLGGDPGLDLTGYRLALQLEVRP